MTFPGERDQLQAALSATYALDRELGRGGMATVFLAHDRKHGRAVALKVLHPELASSLGPERFRREIAFAAGLQHPAHPHRAGFRRDRRRAALVHHAVRRGGEPPVPPPARATTPGGRIAAHHARGRQRARFCAPTRRHSSRHQAREHPRSRPTARHWSRISALPVRSGRRRRTHSPMSARSWAPRPI